tara:strand:- start:215 stop:325 length:111 start_codon:yes stop_codon:yes gene_type:complete
MYFSLKKRNGTAAIDTRVIPEYRNTLKSNDLKNSIN